MSSFKKLLPLLILSVASFSFAGKIQMSGLDLADPVPFEPTCYIIVSVPDYRDIWYEVDCPINVSGVASSPGNNNIYTAAVGRLQAGETAFYVVVEDDEGRSRNVFITGDRSQFSSISIPNHINPDELVDQYLTGDHWEVLVNILGLDYDDLIVEDFFSH